MTHSHCTCNETHNIGLRGFNRTQNTLDHIVDLLDQLLERPNIQYEATTQKGPNRTGWGQDPRLPYDSYKDYRLGG